MIKRWLRDERGASLVLVLAFMVLAVPLITSALALCSTLSIDSRVKTRIMKSQYSVMGAGQYAVSRLLYEPGYASNLEIEVPDEYTIMLNGEEITITVLKLSDTITAPSPPPADDSRRLQTQKEVTPAEALADTLTTFTYTIIITNRDDDESPLRKIRDLLPPGFSYVPGSTRDVTTDEPTIQGQELIWNLAPLQIILQPGESVTLIFDAQASVPEGNYCNEASWVEPGDENTSTGMTALVQVGSPPDSLCQGPAANVTKELDWNQAPGDTVFHRTYTIAIQNTGNVVLNMSGLRDLLPEGFSYVFETTSGDITSEDPISMMWQGRNRLTWDFVPNEQFQPGGTRTLSFDVQADVEPDVYWNELWVDFDELEYSYYTWPMANLEVMAVFQITVTVGETRLSAQLWLGHDSHVLSDWTISRG